MEDLYRSSLSQEGLIPQVFGVFCVAMFIQVFLMFPETRQKSLEEIGMYLALKVTDVPDILFEEHIAPWKTRSGSRMDQRAASYQHGESGIAAKRNSDTTLQQDENVDKVHEKNGDQAANIV